MNITMKTVTEVIDRFDGTEYEFLSNFYPCKIYYEGITYPTTEHAFQAAKTMDACERLAIAGLESPGQSKRAGRKVKLRPDWEEVKVSIMYDILRLKFMSNNKTSKLLQQKLLDTDSAELIEGNTWNDKFWGVCDGSGENMLGRLLMLVREEIKDYKIAELTDEVAYLKEQIQQLEEQQVGCAIRQTM